MGGAKETNDGQGARAWDSLVRITHWGVAAAVLLNGFITEEGSSIHVWVGYGAFALLILRLIWGVVGAEEARFSAFPPSLSAARAHIGAILAGRHETYRSHNPLGALMVYALWGMLALVTATGIAMAGSPFAPRDPSSAVVAERGGDDARYAVTREHDSREHAEHEDGEREHEDESLLEELHETFANLLLVLAGLHVAGVGFESWRGERGLVARMSFGGRGQSSG